MVTLIEANFVSNMRASHIASSFANSLVWLMLDSIHVSQATVLK